MARYQLYSTAHKGLRRALFEATGEAGRCNPSSPEATAHLAATARRLLSFLDEHAAHEDRVLMPELAALAPELHAALREEHARGDGLQREVGALAARLDAAARGAAAERAALVGRLSEGLAQLTALHLLHMAREEREAQRVLAAHRDDVQLAALHGRILAAIPPARTAEWLALFLPAVSPPEQAGLLSGLRAAPVALRRSMAEVARATLGGQAYERAAAAAGLEP